MNIQHYYVPFDVGQISVTAVTSNNTSALIVLPGRSMSARNFWHYDPGTGITHSQQLANSGVDVYMVDALGFGSSIGFDKSRYNRQYFAEQLHAVIEPLREKYKTISCAGFCNTTVVPVMLLAQGFVDKAIVHSPLVFDRAWCEQYPGQVRRWQRTATESGLWETSIDLLIENQLNKISDSQIGKPQRVDTWRSEMSRLTATYTSFNAGTWTAPRVWWLDRIEWPLAHDNFGFEPEALDRKPLLLMRGEYDVEVAQRDFDRAIGYFNNSKLSTATLARATHFSLWEHGYQQTVDTVKNFILD